MTRVASNLAIAAASTLTARDYVGYESDRLWTIFYNQQSAISNQQSAISNQQSAISNMYKKFISRTLILAAIITPDFSMAQISNILNAANNISKNIDNNRSISKDSSKNTGRQPGEMVVFSDPIEVYFSDEIEYKKNFLRDNDDVGREQWIKNPGISYNAPKSINNTELNKFSAAILQIFFNKLNSNELSKAYKICKSNLDSHWGEVIDIMMRNAKESITTEKREEKIRSAKEIIDSRAELAPSMCATRFIRQILFAMNIPGYSSAQNRSSGDEIGFEGIWTGHEYRAANAVITRQLTDKFYNKIAEELIVPESEWIENYASFIFDSSGNRVYKIKQPLATRVYGGYIKNAFNITPFIKRGEVKP